LTTLLSPGFNGEDVEVLLSIDLPSADGIDMASSFLVAIEHCGTEPKKDNISIDFENLVSKISVTQHTKMVRLALF